MSTLYDPDANIAIGTAYLRQLYDKYGPPYQVLAGYNAGPAPLAFPESVGVRPAPRSALDAMVEPEPFADDADTAISDDAPLDDAWDGEPASDDEPPAE